MRCLKSSMFLCLLLITSCFDVSSVRAEETDAKMAYRIQPGDVLQIGVWHEPDLSMEVIVRPDGGISLPLVGEVMSGGKTLTEVHDVLVAKYGKYIPDTDVFVAVRQLSGNKVYIIGKVARPSEFAVTRDTDIMQALSMAGGLTPFADANNIKVLRRTEQGQIAIPFRYGDVEKGIGLDQNIVLHSGDVVVVP